MKDVFTIKGAQDQLPIQLSVTTWMPEQEPLKIVHICHGLAEYAQRYEDFALYLNTLGYGVVAHDHRQQGKSVREGEKVGIFQKEDTWAKIIEDVGLVQKHIRKMYQVPMVLMGHSMGSVIARNFLQTTDLDFEEAIFSGVPDMTNALWQGGLIMAGILSIFNKDKPSPFLDNLSVGAFNKPFEPAKTPVDWLSRDPAICEAYVKDPLCGYAYNPHFYKELSKGFIQAYKGSNIKKMPKIPMLFITGEKDPVGASREHMIKVFEHYKNHGLEGYAKQMIFGGMRHEILNEIDKETVYRFVGDFIKE